MILQLAAAGAQGGHRWLVTRQSNIWQYTWRPVRRFWLRTLLSQGNVRRQFEFVEATKAP